MESQNEEFKTYFSKLVKTVETQSLFTFGNIMIVDKQRIDDILCCIDIAFPALLKKFKQHGGKDRNVVVYKLYDSLIRNIKINPFFIKSLYAVNFDEVSRLSKDIVQSVDQEETYIAKSYPELLN